MFCLTPDQLRPFVRCVGQATGLFQQDLHVAYDHRMILALNGQGTIRWAQGEEPLGAQELLLIAPGVPYQVCSQPEQQVIVINFDWTYACAQRKEPILSVRQGHFQREQITQRVDWSGLFPEGDHLRMKAPTGVIELSRRLLERYLAPKNQRAVWELSLSALMMELTALLLDRSPRQNPQAEAIYRYMQEHCTQPLDLRQVAEEFHFHPSYVNRLLSGCYGISFRQLLIRLRLMRAVALLENSALSAEQIAEQVGFYDGKHFAEAFRKRYGKTPAQYR